MAHGTRLASHTVIAANGGTEGGFGDRKRHGGGQLGPSNGFILQPILGGLIVMGCCQESRFGAAGKRKMMVDSHQSFLVQSVNHGFNGIQSLLRIQKGAAS